MSMRRPPRQLTFAPPPPTTTTTFAPPLVIRSVEMCRKIDRPSPTRCPRVTSHRDVASRAPNQTLCELLLRSNRTRQPAPPPQLPVLHPPWRLPLIRNETGLVQRMSVQIRRLLRWDRVRRSQSSSFPKPQQRHPPPEQSLRPSARCCRRRVCQPPPRCGNPWCIVAWSRTTHRCARTLNPFERLSMLQSQRDSSLLSAAAMAGVCDSRWRRTRGRKYPTQLRRGPSSRPFAPSRKKPATRSRKRAASAICASVFTVICSRPRKYCGSR
mmetsp:Transcript_26012/g.80367  ORF Transcript_26012/g.80367 Transcript_26012/m.80367 type:complete len:269 (+) Transcript_26012:967-1773(+)